MEDKSFQSGSPDAVERPNCDRYGNPIPDDPSFEEMEEILERIERRRNLPEIVIRLEIQPFRF
ncbi:MAG TPA: hypothetical protein VFT79_13030 [Solirubrobacterales bacterium]|nr:hypothetical protein [Solirubrobacterales bacterium]